MPVAIAAAFVFAVYVWSISSAIGWLDAPEFVAASVVMGAAHSPGHPPPLLLGRLGALIPVGDLAFRVHLMSAVAGTGAVAAMAVAGSRVWARVCPDVGRTRRQIVASAVALVFGLSWAVWFQSLRAEVYALVAALIMTALAVLIPTFIGTASAGDCHDRGGVNDGASDDGDAYQGDLAGRNQAGCRELCLAALLFGLALATHPFIALSALLPVIVVIVLWRWPPLRHMLHVAFWGSFGLIPLLYLPVRAMRDPLVNWGVPANLDRFWWTISARAFQNATTRDRVGKPGEDALQAAITLAEQATWPLAACALLAIYLGMRRAPTRALTAVLAGVWFTAVGARALIGFDGETPDDQGYLLPGLAAFLLLALLGLGILVQAGIQLRATSAGRGAGAGSESRTARGLATVFAILVMAGAVWQGVRHHEQADLSEGEASDVMARWELESLPADALVLSSYFQTSFRMWALRAMEDARPDVVVLDRSLLTYPGMAAAARRAHPSLTALIDAPLRAGARTPVVHLSQLARQRPVLIQLHVNLDDAGDDHILPAGAFAAWSPEPTSLAMQRQASARDWTVHETLAARLASAAVPAEFADTRNALLWQHTMRLLWFCRRASHSKGDVRQRAHARAAAQAVLAQAWALAPGDRGLRASAADCGLAVDE